MGLIKEFKEFAARGSVVDLAVGVVIGGAFGGIVASFVADVLMPPVGLLLGGVDFKWIVITLRQATGENPAVTMNIGTFINAVINFLIIAFAVFLVVKGANKMRLNNPAPPAEPTEEVLLLREIRDSLKK